jgi:hypothetical protein
VDITVLFKKGDKSICDNYRGISLINHWGKVLERLIQNRLLPYVLELEGCIPESQCGFLPGRSTSDAIIVSRTLASNALERGIKLFKCFIDLTKAYDRVDRNTLWLVLEKYGVPPKLLKLIQNLHVGAMARVKLGDGVFSDWFELLRGLKQGSVFAPLLFNIFFGAIINAFHNECQKVSTVLGVQFGFDFSKKSFECFIANKHTTFTQLMEILFADDCELFAESEEALNIMVNIFDRVAMVFAQELSIPKTKVMVVERINAIQRARTIPIIQVRGKTLEVVDQFTYLGSRESNEGDMTSEIAIRKQRMVAAFSTWSGRILLNPKISERLRLVFFNMIVVPNGLYGCATWNLSARDIKQLDSVQYRLLKRLLFIGKIRKISYERVLKLCEDLGCRIIPMECRILKLQLRYMGHIIRMGNNRLQRIIAHGSISAGKRKQGAPPRNFRHAAKYALENFGYLQDDWHVLALSRKDWRRWVNIDGVDFFLHNWIEKRAKARAIRHAFLLATEIAACDKAKALKAALTSQAKNRRRKFKRQSLAISQKL